MTYDELKALIEKRGVHPALGLTGEGYNIEQNPHELAVFLEDMLKRGVHKVLEIGSGYRMGLSRFLANDLGWQVVTIDRVQPDFPAANVQFLMGSSEILRPLFEGARFDLVIIDGDNTYEGVKADFLSYFLLATKAVAICKIAGLRGCEGVKQYWDNWQDNQPLWKTYATIDDSPQRSGVGWACLEESLATEDVYPSFLENTIDDLDATIHEPVIIEEEELPAPVKKPRKPRKKSA